MLARDEAIERVGKNYEVTRFKGLGEISPGEFKRFIREDIKITPVNLSEDDSIKNILSFYMGKNTPARQSFIIDNINTNEL